MIPEFKLITDAVNSFVLKLNGGEITREDIGDAVVIFFKQSILLNNALIDTLTEQNGEDGPMAFADLLSEVSDDMRNNDGKYAVEMESNARTTA